MDKKVKIALLSVLSNTILIILKIIAGIMSGSVSIISEAIHSGMDLVASIVAYFSVRISSKPADDDHPYGHEKIENISGFIEGALIFIAAFLIVKEAIHKMIIPTQINQATIAVVVMAISALINFFVSKRLYQVAKEENSMALQADALHLKTDIYTSVGVAVGLLLIKITGMPIFDPIVAILVALLIVKEAWHLCKNAFSQLMDASLSPEEEIKICEILKGFDEKIIEFHKLRTRSAGKMKYVDFHLVVANDLRMDEANRIRLSIEQAIEKVLPHTEIHIQMEADEILANHN